MYPSNPSRIGIPSPFGIAPSSVHGVSNLVDDTCGPSFSWLTQSGVQSSSLLNEQSAGGALKIGTADQMIDRSSFMSLDRHTPSLPRLTPHSIVAASSSNSSSLAMESHSGGGGASQQSAAAAADGGVVVGGPFHPYRTANDGMPSVAAGVAHPSLSNSQFAAFDSIYKAYQNAYGSSSAAAAAAGMFGNQQYRYDSSLLAAEQQMLLQASLLQYPHLGIFPNAALYPNLQSGLRYPGDYYCQNLASLSLLSKYPDMTGPSWLGIDRSSAMSAFPSEREKELKEYDPRKDQPDPSKRFEREALLSEHHKARHDRDDVRREPRTDDARKDHSSSSSSASRHHADKEGLKNEQQKRSTSLRSPARHEHRHQDPSFSKFNAGHNEFTYTASRLQSGVTCATTMEPLNLQKSLLSPSSTIHQQQQQQQQRHAASRRDRNFELPQDYALAKERHQMGLHSKSDDMRDKRLPSTLSGLPKPASSVMNPVMSPAQFKGQYEQKFHRPFEQGHQPSANDPGEATERQLGGLPSSHRDRLPSNTKTSLVYERKDYTGPSRTTSDGKSLHENHRHQHQQQQLLAKANDRKMQALTPTASKRRSTELNDEMPLNLALTKVAHMDSSANGEQERGGQGRPRIDLLAQESAGMTNAVGNSYVRRKSVTGGVPGNSAVRSSDKTRRGDYVGPDAGYKASSCSLQQKPLVSKLDVMIARKTKSAAAAGNSDDEMDEEKWENTCKEVAKCLLITSGPALADENSQQKIQFLGIFGLVTTDAFKELEFKQHQRRRHQMHESSLSPIQLDSEPASSAAAAAAGGDQHPPPSSVFNDKLDAAETSRSSTDKDSLLHLLHLRSVKTQGDQQRGSSVQLSSHVDHLPVPSAKATMPLHQISKRHRHPVERSNSTTPPRCTNRVDGCDVERERLHQQQQQLMMMGTEFLTHLRTSNAYDKLQQNDNSSSSSRRPMMLDHPPFAFDANRSQQKSRALASDLQTTTGPSCQDHCNHSTATDGAGGGGGALDVVSSHPPPCLSDVSSLHTKSATRSTSSLMISKELIDGSSPLSSALHHTAAASSSDMESAFNWPGHEAIIESYYHYIEERSMERQLLSEQNRRLHHLNNDLVLKSEQLRSHMTGLLQTKEQLAGNRCRLQSAVDDLKVCLKSLQ